MSSPENEGGSERFLSRWSRKKQEAREESESARTAAPPPPPDPLPHEKAERAPGPAAEPAPAPDRPPLPDIASLTAASDIRAFMRPDVPQALRRAAPARIWSLDPAIRDFREMADYDWDFNVAGGAPGYGPLEASAEQIEHWLARILPPDQAPDIAGEPEAPAGPTQAAGTPPEPPPTPARRSDRDHNARLPGVEDEKAAPSSPQAHAHRPLPVEQGPPADRAEPHPGDAPAPRPRRHGGAVPI